MFEQRVAALALVGTRKGPVREGLEQELPTPGESRQEAGAAGGARELGIREEELLAAAPVGDDAKH